MIFESLSSRFENISTGLTSERRAELIDLVILNGSVASHEGISTMGIAIDKGKIVALGGTSALPPAKKTINASGKYVIPGLIDGHVHIGLTHPFADDCETETKASAVGGVTSIGIHIIDFFEHLKGFLSFAELCRKAVEQRSVVDAFFHAQIMDEQGFEEIPKAQEIGITSFKATWGEMAGASGLMFRSLEQVDKLGPKARVIVHAEDRGVIDVLTKRLIEQGRKDFPAWNDSRPAFCETAAVISAIFWGKLLNCPLYFEHVTNGQSLDIIKQAKSEGMDVIAETCQQYLTHTSEDKGILSEIPALGHVNPPLRDKESNARLWQGIKDGVIDCIGSDHTGYTLKDKGDDLWKAPPGLGQSGMILPVMFSKGVKKGRISLEKLVEICCFKPAKVWGIYPQKGTIQVGSDADIVIIDPDKKVKVSWKRLHSICDWSIYEGWEFQGWPVLTILRGEIIAKDGEVVAKPGIGRYLKRKL